MDQKGYHRWDLLRLNKYTGLEGRYSLKQRNPIYFFFKTLMQLYFLRSSLYTLTYYIKEVIRGKIFWRINLKVLAYEAAAAWNRGIPCNFSQHWSNCSCFLYFSILDYCIKESIKGNFLDMKFKSVGLWGSYDLKQGNPLQNIKISNQIVFGYT